MTLLSEIESPSEYLLKRFDAITEFEDVVNRQERYSQRTVYDVRYSWRNGDRCKILEHPVIYIACVKLEAVLGIEDPYWRDGR